MRRSRIPEVATRHTSRAINQQVILNLLLAHEPVSRAQLARRLGMQRSAVSRIVQDLIEAGLVREGLAGEGERGRKPTLLHLDSRGRCAVAVDVRRTRTFVVLTDLVGHELSPVRSFLTDREPREFLLHLATEVLRLLSEHPEAGRCQGVGVAFPGMLDWSGSTVVHAPALGYGTRSACVLRLGARGEDVELWWAEGAPCTVEPRRLDGLAEALRHSQVTMA